MPSSLPAATSGVFVSTYGRFIRLRNHTVTQNDMAEAQYVAAHLVPGSPTPQPMVELQRFHTGDRIHVASPQPQPPPLPTAHPWLLWWSQHEGVLLHNRKNEARDNLANERTLLAWIRAAVWFSGLCFLVYLVVEKNNGHAKLAAELGLHERVWFRLLHGFAGLLLLTALVTLALGLLRYYTVAYHLNGFGWFAASQWEVSVVIGVIMTVVLVLVALVAVVATRY